MTDKTALRQLIEAVEAGKIYLPDSERWEALTMSGYLTNKAFYGSLDAAKALHEALLPGWIFEVYRRSVAVENPINGRRYFGQKAEGGPARLWLIAILKAYEAQK